MKFPLSLTAGMAGYIFKNKMRPRPECQKDVAPPKNEANPFRILHSVPVDRANRQPHPMIRKRFPLVMMLEPLHACNLTCTGCGRIRDYESTITQRVPLEERLAAADAANTNRPCPNACRLKNAWPRWTNAAGVWCRLAAATP